MPWSGVFVLGMERRPHRSRHFAWRAHRKTGYESPVQISRFYADLGDKERAFQWLDTAYREHDWLLQGLNTFYQFDSLRSDPRFAELVRKVGLPQH